MLDIACSGGIDSAWRAFEPRLQTLGIDASVSECRRAAEQERNPEVSYLAALESRRARLRGASTEDKLRHNAWEMTGLADPNRLVVTPDLLAERGWASLDCLEIDIDGPDLDVLQSFAGRFDPLDTLAVQTEVNFTDTPAVYPPQPKPPEPGRQPPPPRPRPTFVQRLRAAWCSVSDWSCTSRR